jgi:hypothetical protein
MENAAKTRVETLTEEHESYHEANEDLLFENTSFDLTVEDAVGLRDELTERIHMCDVRSERFLNSPPKRRSSSGDQSAPSSS